MPLPDSGGLTLAQRAQIDAGYAEAIAKGDVQLANAWVVFANTFWPQHPTFTVHQVAQAFLAVEVSGGLGTAISNIGTFVGASVPEAAASAAQSLPKIPNPLSPLAAIASFITKLGNPHTWLRVGEFIIGFGLLAIGLNALLHNPAGKIPKVVPV